MFTDLLFAFNLGSKCLEYSASKNKISDEHWHEFEVDTCISCSTMQYVTDADLIDVSSLYPSPMRLVGTWNA